MTWDEFSALLNGILPDSPLGKIVSMRSEEDKEVLKSFTQDQKAERTRWRTREATKIEEKDMDKVMENLEKMLASAFG